MACLAGGHSAHQSCVSRHRSHVAFTPNSEYLISSSLSAQTPKVRIWDYTSSRAVKTYSGHKSAKFGGPAVICPCIEPLDPESRSGAAAAASRAYVVSGGEGNEVTVWDLQTREVLQVIDAHAGGVIAVAVSFQTLESSLARC